jgi:hypothetical protein
MKDTDPKAVKSDGGSAFPEIFTDHHDGDLMDTYSAGGMTLRDYYAGQALAGFCCPGDADDSPSVWDYDVLAGCAYRAADAMLRAREEST